LSHGGICASPVAEWRIEELEAKLGEPPMTPHNSSCVDGYFEEMNLATIRVDDPTRIKLMGHSEILRGHVASIARAINVANAHPANSGGGQGQLDRHVDAPGSAHPGSHSYR
jgi:hypothetical protein